MQPRVKSTASKLEEISTTQHPSRVSSRTATVNFTARSSHLPNLIVPLQALKSILGSLLRARGILHAQFIDYRHQVPRGGLTAQVTTFLLYNTQYPQSDHQSNNPVCFALQTVFCTLFVSSSLHTVFEVFVRRRLNCKEKQLTVIIRPPLLCEALLLRCRMDFHSQPSFGIFVSFQDLVELILYR